MLLPLVLQAWHQCAEPGLLLHTLSPVSVEAGRVLHTAHHALLSLTLMSWAVLLQGIMQVGVLFTQVTTVTLMLAAVQALEVRPTLGRSQCLWSGLSACAPASVQLNWCLLGIFNTGGTCLSLGACPLLWLHPGIVQRISVQMCLGGMDLQRWGMAASHQVHLHCPLT